MLKVVGASWLQTRISTYILITVVLLGISIIILCQFVHVEPDGIYSATVSWNRKGGYHIDFWGQSNNLIDVPLNTARAYYRTSILESGWSIIEIETSPNYPDIVQAYAAGLLEGSLTWQLIHHHWYNTIRTVCEKWPTDCKTLMQYLHENTAIIRKRADLLGATDPFWHMVRLFYIQLDGLEIGWKFAVRRSRQTVEMDSEYFLWLAMAADLPDLEQILNSSESHSDYSKGMIFLKLLKREKLDPLIAVAHTTAAPYVKMLRLLKKYNFAYHTLPNTGALVPGRSIVMSSYPGALSSQDEFYVMQGQNHELIVTGTPLSTANRFKHLANMKDQLSSSVRLMVANRLAKDGRSWSNLLRVFAHNDGSAAWQWVTLEPQTRTIWFVEQSPGFFNTSYFTMQVGNASVICRTGEPNFNEIKQAFIESNNDDIIRRQSVLQRNITTMEDIRKLIRGYSHEDSNIGKENLAQILTYRKDIEEMAAPFGVIDAKIVIVNSDGLESFEATSGPSTSGLRKSFQWSKIFPNTSHVGHPDIFDFDSITPLWIWV